MHLFEEVKFLPFLTRQVFLYDRRLIYFKVFSIPPIHDFDLKVLLVICNDRNH